MSGGTSLNDCAERRPPALFVRLELEELPTVEVQADSYEDECRLLAWATRPQTINRLAEVVADALDERRAA